ncbi:tail fiber assembly protein [Buttiauxella selenatireducens]|uniref:Tail fiber assembly protein n=1 Tax=Buttiauxella selenatireducens TaxID=3073902 RepID=A0ABY9S5P1_9ENTR|nr:tail fiber assembly protein [Buttiauxella sp. R73]WMY72717.1 tail fiber assembly protein [Buttiauxella sp. R73]
MMTNAILNKKQICTTAGMVTVYNFDGLTGEYSHPSVEVLPVGVGIPAHGCTEKPPAEKTGWAVIRNAENTAWLSVPDHRGETVYCTQTGASVPVTTPGEYPDNTTRLVPATDFDTWSGTEWVTDTDAQSAAAVQHARMKRDELILEAEARSSDWKVDLMLGMLSDEDQSRLIAWRGYIKQLQSLDTSAPEHITWPELPTC